MSYSAPAEVIPFPCQLSRHAAADRLDVALDDLIEALAAHRAAVAAWHGALEELRTALRTVGGSVDGYRTQLAALNKDIGRLHGEARRLERWADTLNELG